MDLKKNSIRPGADTGTKYAEMVQNWWRLGFVVSTDDGVSYEEAERTEGGPIT